MITILHPLVGLLIAGVVFAQATPQQPIPQTPPVPTGQEKPAPVEKLGPSTFRIGTMRVDTAKREVVVPGTMNPPATLEFVASTQGGLKAYESAMTLDTNAVTFNAAMLLIGLDPARARPAKFQFDPTPPQGDPVEITVEWKEGSRTRRIKVEELLYDQRTKKALQNERWVYTGSTFIEDGTGKRFLAELDGVLIGFMHGPQAIIDTALNQAVGAYGFIILNPTLKLTENTPISVTIRALPLEQKR